MALDRSALKQRLVAAEKMQATLTGWFEDARRASDNLWQLRFQEAMYALMDLVGRLERAMDKMAREAPQS